VGELSDYSSLDTYFGYALPSLLMTGQAGGSNLLDSSNTQVYGGPNIGRLVDVK
jgi:iron complex outermembrane receptor protein